MRAESGGDEVQDELAEVRRLLDAFVERRLTHPFSPAEQEEFDQLSERERVALGILACRPSSAGTGTRETATRETGTQQHRSQQG